ncbi:MAG: ABC transporter substrate-binding protein [Dehalococcoidia bacterium]|nr:ABC transporter substrate-binding protein [Dehalococcoidia bacterium]
MRTPTGTSRPKPWSRSRSRSIGAVTALALALAVACGGAAAPTATARPAPALSVETQAGVRQLQLEARDGQATATPTRPAPTAVASVAASRGKIIYAKPVDMGRATSAAAGGAGGPDTPFASSINAGLTNKGLDGQLVPWLASSWAYSSSDAVLDITLRKGAVFQDGSPITVDDVLYSLNIWLNPITPGVLKPNLPVMPSAIEKTGPDTFRVAFPRPDPFFLTATFNTLSSAGEGWYIYPRAAVERMGIDAFNKAPVASGPYKLVKRIPGDSVLLEAHEQFFNGPPPVKTIEVRIAPEDSTRVAMFQTGEADIVESVAPQYLPNLERLAGAKIFSTRTGQEVVINIQTAVDKIPGTDRPNPFKDVRVRQAVSYAVDKKAIVERIAGRAGAPVKGPYSTYHLGAVPDKITDYDYNPEKAKQLLKDANFPMDYQFPVYAYVASAPAPQAVEAFANYLQAVGLKAQYRLVEVSALIGLWRAKEAFPMSFVRSWNIYPDPSRHFVSYMKSDGGTSFYADPVLDQIWADAFKIADPTKQAQAYEKFFTYIHEQAYVVDLYAIVDNHGIGPKVDWRYPPGLPNSFNLITWR